MFGSSLFSWTKSVSTSTIFIGIFALIFSVFLFSNTSVILSKFGFETTTSLKGKLTKAEEQLKAAKLENDTFQKEIERYKKLTEENNKALAEANMELKKVNSIVDKVQKERSSKKREIVKELDSKTTVTETEITLPIKEYNELSSTNIESIHSAYDQLLQDNQTTATVKESSLVDFDDIHPALA